MTSVTTTKTGQPATTETYALAYARLSEIAQKLRGPVAAATVDTLAADVRAARDAYALCRARLDAIRVEIDGELAAVRADGDAPGAA